MTRINRNVESGSTMSSGPSMRTLTDNWRHYDEPVRPPDVYRDSIDGTLVPNAPNPAALQPASTPAPTLPLLRVRDERHRSLQGDAVRRPETPHLSHPCAAATARTPRRPTSRTRWWPGHPTDNSSVSSANGKALVRHLHPRDRRTKKANCSTSKGPDCLPDDGQSRS